VAGFCEHGGELPGPIKKVIFFDKVSDSFSNNILHHEVSVLRRN
jgi:hypothetical protein